MNLLGSDFEINKIRLKALYYVHLILFLFTMFIIEVFSLKF